MTHPTHSKNVVVALEELESDARKLQRIMIELVAPSGSPMFPLDFLAFAATKRHASTTSAFVSAINSWNMVVARSLLRIHIDTSLRFSAAWHVENPHDFSMEVLRGARIDKLKTRSGDRLTDAYLVKLHKDKHPWLPDVYEHLCGYVHFSGSHITDAINDLSDGDGTVEFLISDQDQRFPEFSWLEVAGCFREATGILETYLRGWGTTKQLSPEQLESLRSGV
ncbi:MULTISPECIES: hypothetical protein [Pseudoxanthomonas]|uniref:Uncharacterized protein n=1 Tax=Pseudoxanthomonas mexicana TaxID=128785 RepID=A0ABX6RCN1_PSEMX|nr:MULTISPECIES: hypothetical protein [Pseudoxanthomonas]QND81005.1 hypothetical protein H4W19_04225 [Pseudoxanthomonas mexicana]